MTPSIAPASAPQSPNDVAAHAEASYVRTPRENRVVAEPATPTTCRRDYENAADVRATVARQQARTRR
ncbi:hypothetical protein ACFCX0_03635 [Streptomyces sp. NPDC056352]|uniref:hypothetical protein n=1 Tax=Streptomyces sp. NPDC056352 TaxID=3345791 RepID=UPI0035E35500